MTFVAVPSFNKYFILFNTTVKLTESYFTEERNQTPTTLLRIKQD